MRREPTPFQVSCVRSTQELLARLALSYEVQFVDGRGESYFIARLTQAGKKYELYIYEDGAGFYVDGEWHVHEWQDYDTLEELAKTFLNDLASGLSPQKQVEAAAEPK